MEDSTKDFKVIKKGNFNPNIKITDLKSRKPPKREYSDEYKDLFDQDYIPENINELTEDQQEAYKSNTQAVRESILPEIEENMDIYRNYTKENIDKYILKYQGMLTIRNKFKFFFWTLFMRIFKKEEYLKFENKRAANFVRLYELEKMRIHAKG